jgi:prepilin-type N-terminal cleavage/methylation domain-containing protein
MPIKNGKQNGFTLIEIVLALAITGILGGGIATFTAQTFTETKRSSTHMQEILQLENAGYWLSRDVQMSQNVTAGPNAGFPLLLKWVDENNDTFQVTYSLSDGQIQRSLSKNSQAPSDILIAHSIDSTPTLTYCNYQNGLLVFKATATRGTWSTSRTYQIKQRPGK